MARTFAMQAPELGGQGRTAGWRPTSAGPANFAVARHPGHAAEDRLR